MSATNGFDNSTRNFGQYPERSIFYTLMADEVTDGSNKEQFVICLRSVDINLTPHEDFIGLHFVDNISSATLVACLKDVLIRMNLSIQNCRGQCYDGASNMVGAKKGVATEIPKIQPRAILTHCYGHSLQLAVGGTVKQIKNLRDMFDTTSEISKLLKCSPKRNRRFHKLKDELVPETLGFRTLCPTRWTMRAASLQNVVENWIALQELWDDVLETKLDAETKGRVLGAKYQMETFEYFYCVFCEALVLKHSDNLSKTLQHTYISVSKGKEIAELTVKSFQKVRSDDSFDMFWNTVTKRSKELKVNDPCLPRKRQRPARYLLLQIHRKIITGICIFRQLIQSSPASKKVSIKLDTTYTTGNLKSFCCQQ